jgi:hypothetical protein
MGGKSRSAALSDQPLVDLFLGRQPILELVTGRETSVLRSEIGRLGNRRMSILVVVGHCVL